MMRKILFPLLILCLISTNVMAFDDNDAKQVQFIEIFKKNSTTETNRLPVVYLGHGSFKWGYKVKHSKAVFSFAQLGATAFHKSVNQLIYHFNDKEAYGKYEKYQDLNGETFIKQLNQQAVNAVLLRIIKYELQIMEELDSKLGVPMIEMFDKGQYNLRYFACLERQDLVCPGYVTVYYDSSVGWMEFKGEQDLDFLVVNKSKEIDEDEENWKQRKDEYINYFNNVTASINVIVGKESQLNIYDFQGYVNVETGDIVVSDPTGFDEKGYKGVLPKKWSEVKTSSKFLAWIQKGEDVIQ